MAEWLRQWTLMKKLPCAWVRIPLQILKILFWRFSLTIFFEDFFSLKIFIEDFFSLKIFIEDFFLWRSFLKIFCLWRFFLKIFFSLKINFKDHVEDCFEDLFSKNKFFATKSSKDCIFSLPFLQQKVVNTAFFPFLICNKK